MDGIFVLDCRKCIEVRGARVCPKMFLMKGSALLAVHERPFVVHAQDPGAQASSLLLFLSFLNTYRAFNRTNGLFILLWT